MEGTGAGMGAETREGKGRSGGGENRKGFARKERRVWKEGRRGGSVGTQNQKISDGHEEESR